MSKTPLDMRETWNKVGMTEIEIWNNASQNDRDKMAERATIERCAMVADAFSDLCRCEKDVALQISAAIRALKDKP